MKKIISFNCLLLILGCITSNTWPLNGFDYTAYSPESLIASTKQNLLYIAARTANQIAIFDPANNSISSQIAVPDQPTGLVLADNDKKLYITCSGKQHVLCEVDLESNGITQILPAGWGARSPVMYDSRVFVCNQFDHSVSVFNIDTGDEIKRINVPREPYSSVLSSQGDYLFVAHRLPDSAANLDYVAATISVIHTQGLHVVNEIQLPNGSTSLNDVCLSSDGQHLFVTHILAHYQLPTTQLERGWINSNALSVIDAKERTLLKTVLLDNVDRGAANPWGMTCSNDGKHLFVTHAGTDEISMIDIPALLKKISDTQSNDKYDYETEYEINEKASPDLTFMTDIRIRIPSQGKGPRHVAIHDDQLYVTNYFSDTLTSVDLSQDTLTAIKRISFSAEENSSLVRQGEMFFHDATLCFQGWQSCVSCHPGGRVDGLNWDLLNDGIGNPKNTKSLLFSHQTPPAMSTGVRGSAEYAVRSGFHHILFVQGLEDEAKAIDEYLKAMRPLPSPYAQTINNCQQIQKGMELFFSQKTRCASCHDGSFYTDLKTYDVGTSPVTASHHKFDTPTLIELWRTAPYLHDGQAATLRDVLTTCNHNDLHGVTSHLTEIEIDALLAFLLSL